VSATGAARERDTGILKLVGMARVPSGFSNGGENHLLVVEVLASLEFGTSIDSPSRPSRLSGLGRRGN
jgi:hypothetical protein